MPSRSEFRDVHGCFEPGPTKGAWVGKVTVRQIHSQSHAAHGGRIGAAAPQAQRDDLSPSWVLGRVETPSSRTCRVRYTINSDIAISTPSPPGSGARYLKLRYAACINVRAQLLAITLWDAPRPPRGSGDRRTVYDRPTHAIMPHGSQARPSPFSRGGCAQHGFCSCRCCGAAAPEALMEAHGRITAHAHRLPCSISKCVLVLKCSSAYSP